MCKKYIPVILLLIHTLPSSAQRLYVRASATGNNTGQSWTHAFTDLQSALKIAQKGDSVWVAEGLYRPTNTIDRAISFEPHSGVVIIGGFAGTESALIQRDWAAHPTILSGDIGIAGDSTDNSYNVVYLFEPDSSTVLDGLMIRDGVADNETFATDIYSRLICGGGIYIMAEHADAYPDIRHCSIIHNTALYFGGGVIVNGNNDGSTAPRFIDCTFENNYAGKNGGGLAKYGASEVERGMDYESCHFVANQAGGWGGGIYYLDGNGVDQIGINKCVFHQNSAAVRGGGISLILGSVKKSGVLFQCCTFTNNLSEANGSGIDVYNNFTNFNGIFILDSCLFSLNKCYVTPSASIYLDLFLNEYGEVKVYQSEFYNNNVLSNVSFNGSYEGVLSIQQSIFKDQFLKNYNIEVHELDKLKLTNCKFLFAKIGDVYFNTINNASLLSNLFVSNKPIDRRFKFSSNDTSYIRNCTIHNLGKENNMFYSKKAVYIENTYYNIFNSNLGQNSALYLSHNYLGGFDCATAPLNVVCMDGNIFSGDPMFTDTAQGNYTPLPCSPLANAGSNAFVGPEDSVDIVGTPRIQGGRVDIGAFESPGPRVTTTPEVQGACGPSANGSVSFFPQNACPPYTGQWSNGAVSGNGFTQLYAGNYAFTLTDARGATCTATASIPHYEAFTLESFSEPVQCGDTLGGRGWANVSGGLPPYVFLWDNGSKDSLQTELPAGIHPLRVQDAHGCKDQTNVVVEGIGGLKIAVTSTPVHCYGVPDGTLTIQALNGKAPYTYIWENGPATPEYQGLGPGVYKGTLTDALGCRIVWVLPLSEPDSLHVEAVVTPSTDPLTHNGRIQVTGISGGTAPFTLSWSNGAIGALLENLAPGVYTCTLTDAEGCTQTIIYTITLEVGTEEAGLGFSFALWPNPARDAVFIRDLGQTGTVQCSIYNALGVLMYQRSSAQLDEAVDIRHWPAGVYTCVVQSAGGKRWIERFGVGR